MSPRIECLRSIFLIWLKYGTNRVMRPRSRLRYKSVSNRCIHDNLGHKALQALVNKAALLSRQHNTTRGRYLLECNLGLYSCRHVHDTHLRTECYHAACSDERTQCRTVPRPDAAKSPHLFPFLLPRTHMCISIAVNMALKPFLEATRTIKLTYLGT
jgi:hypothetical protein